MPDLLTPESAGAKKGVNVVPAERDRPTTEVEGTSAAAPVEAPATAAAAIARPVPQMLGHGGAEVEEAWRRIQVAVAQEAAKAPIVDGHEPVQGGTETAIAEVDQLTAGAAGTAETAGTAPAILIEAGQAAPFEETFGYGEPGAPTIPDTQEIVHGADDRVQVTNTAAYPFRTVCQLEITAPNGKTYIGSGAFIGPRVILTAGHCVYLRGDGGWARQIRVIPGRNGAVAPFGSAIGTRFLSVLGWTRDGDGDHDYGAIVLPTPLGNSVGWMGLANLSFLGLLGLNVNNSGYPGDKSYGTQWWNANNVLALTDHRLYYRIDTMGGQSGSPVWRFKDGQRHIVGIHTTGGSPYNAATRINGDVFANLVAWKSL